MGSGREAKLLKQQKALLIGDINNKCEWEVRNSKEDGSADLYLKKRDGTCLG